jgi:hypothetical protein
MNDFMRHFQPMYLQQLRSGKWLPVNHNNQPLGSVLTEEETQRLPRTMEDFDHLAFHVDVTTLGEPNADKRIYLEANELELLRALDMRLDPVPPTSCCGACRTKKPKPERVLHRSSNRSRRS